MSGFKQVHKDFVAAAWADRAALEAWLEAARALDPTDHVKLVPVLGRSLGSTPGQRRARLRAFEELAGERVDRRLFKPLLEVVKGADQMTRRRITPILVRCNDPRAHGDLVAQLRARGREARHYAATLLKQVGGRKAFEELGQALPRGSWDSRAEAIDLYATLGGADASRGLADVLRYGTTTDKLQAARVLASLEDCGDHHHHVLEQLWRAVPTADDRLVPQLLRTLGVLADEQDFYEAADTFIEQDDEGLHVAIVSALRNFPTDRTINELERFFRVGSLNVRDAVLDTLAELRLRESVRVLVQGLSDAVLKVRNRSREIITELAREDRIDVEYLVLWGLRSDEAEIRRQTLEIVQSLGKSFDSLVPRLLKMLRDADWWVRERVVDALVAIAGDTLARYVVSYLEDSNDLIRRWAVEVLMRLKDPATAGALVQVAWNDSDWWVRERSLECLGELGDPEAVDHIVQIGMRYGEMLFPALVALERLKERRGLQLATGALAVPDHGLRLQALRTVAAIDDPSAAPWVQPLMADIDPTIRFQALELLRGWHIQIAHSDAEAELRKQMEWLDTLLVKMTEKGADDLFLTVGVPPHVKRMNQVVVLDDQVPSQRQVEGALTALMSPAQRDEMAALKDVDLSITVKTHGLRFRGNIHRQMSGWACVARRIQSEPVRLEELGLPDIVETLCERKHGLILVGGPTGSGKSTTLAAMIDRVNSTRRRHILTIEDPIEVVHPLRQCIVNQREVGTHTDTFGQALRSTLRQDPDVILVGEMRDRETIQFAVTAAETGHLVLGTVHTVSAEMSMDRLINAFPARQHGLVRTMLSQSLQAVVCQQLVRRVDQDGRALAVEVLLNNDAVANLIRKGETFKIPSIIATSGGSGMQSMDSELLRLFEDGVISAEEAYTRALHKRDFQAILEEERLKARPRKREEDDADDSDASNAPPEEAAPELGSQPPAPPRSTLPPELGSRPPAPPPSTPPPELGSRPPAPARAPRPPTPAPVRPAAGRPTAEVELPVGRSRSARIGGPSSEVELPVGRSRSARIDGPSSEVELPVGRSRSARIGGPSSEVELPVGRSRSARIDGPSSEVELPVGRRRTARTDAPSGEVELPVGRRRSARADGPSSEVVMEIGRRRDGGDRGSS